MQLAQIDKRLNRLTDAYVDRVVDKDLFEQRKNALLLERTDLHERIKHWEGGNATVSEVISEILERAFNAYLAYKLGTAAEKRDLVDSLTSNRIVQRKSLEISLLLPFRLIAKRHQLADGDLGWNRTNISALEERCSIH